ncbi:unnamed protein product [Eruca vesicaria subsp. sativa]|uniref:Cinnamoyl CoA reductase n=1 Tax=Eruca vesicaria subsp. sativa TaxID=29727 RepID=A0ABC8K4V9_ERUVS|nr:unnamed protein product [Eruca vesicaria subsp. sativa]
METSVTMREHAPGVRDRARLQDGVWSQVVNVKDVANAHIRAFENPKANGRYCLVERVDHYSEVVNILHDLYPDFLLSEKCADEKIYIPTYKVSKEKAESLGS